MSDSDKRQLAEKRLRETAEMVQLTVTASEAIAIDGLEGVESLADSLDAKTGTPLSGYQVMLFDRGGYILMESARVSWLPNTSRSSGGWHEA